VIVTLGEVIEEAKSDAILGISDRAKIISFIKRGLELAVYKGNLNPTIGTIDVCSDKCGHVTLPGFVGTVLQVNVGGCPTVFRSRWYEFHINGFGSRCGRTCGFTDDAGWSPVFEDLEAWSVVTAICEDAIDGDGSKVMVIEGETMDANQNVKQALTIPVTGPSELGVKIPLLLNVANTDSAVTYFRKITRITKPVTRGYVKLLAFPMRQMAHAVHIGYYAPHETNPRYRRIKVGASCKWVRIIYRRTELPLVNDYDVLPIASLQAMLDLIKSVRLSDSNNFEAAEILLNRGVRLMNEIQTVESGNTYTPIQVDPSWGVGTIDPR
jgi:hypothetical protein